MRTTLPPNAATVLGVVAAGAAGAATLGAWACWAGATPSVILLGVAATGTAAGLRIAPRRGRAWLALAALAPLTFPGAVARGAWALGGPDGAVALTQVIAFALPLLLLAPAADSLGRVSGRHVPLALGVALFALRLPPEFAAALAATSALLSARVDAPIRKLPGPPRQPPRWVGGVLAMLVASAALLLALRARPAVEPAPIAMVALASAAVLAATLGRVWGALVGACSLAGAWAALAGGGVPSWFLFPALGGLGGSAAGVARLGRWSGPAALAAVALAGAALGPVDAIVGDGRLPLAAELGALRLAGATLPTDAPYLRALEAVRTRAPALLDQFGPDGPVVLWPAPAGAIAELDGVVVGATRREREAARIAADLAGCFAGERRRARVVGDDLGAASLGLLRQGFAGIDVSGPDAALFGALAASDDELRRGWLSAGARILRAPAPLALRGGATSDAIVHVERAGWRGSRGAWPDDSLVADLAASLESGGVYVAVLPARGLPPEPLQAAAHAVQKAFKLAALVLPPQGAESVLVVGAHAPPDWRRFTACHEADAAWLRRAGIADAAALASLGVLDAAGIRMLAPGEPPGWFVRSASGEDEGRLSLAELELEAAPLPALLDASAPQAEIASGVRMRRASLTVLSASARGDIPTALAGARAIAGEPGVSGALGPLVDPLLERARAAAARASAEGPESPAWSEADRSVEGALLVHPGSADAQCLKAELAWARRSAEAAQVAWQACADADPTRLDALDGVAMVARVRGDLDTAESVLRRSLALSPSRWQAALNLGVLLTDREQGVEAERWLRRAADLAETDTASGRSRPHLALARLYSTSERPELAAAEARLAERQEATGESAYWLGRALVQSGDLAAAEPWLRTSLARDPERVDARVGLGLCLRARGDYLGAAEAFKAALALDPRHPVARGALEELAPLLRAIPSDVPPRRP